jgi:hypothetical protein
MRRRGQLFEIASREPSKGKSTMKKPHSAYRVTGQPPFRPTLLPFWDCQNKRLFYGENLAKEFHQPAPNQWVALEAFQEDNWKFRIDDPLTGKDGMDRKQRRRNLVKELNRALKFLVFFSDGTGTGICWGLRTGAHRCAPPLPAFSFARTGITS